MTTVSLATAQNTYYRQMQGRLTDFTCSTLLCGEWCVRFVLLFILFPFSSPSVAHSNMARLEILQLILRHASLFFGLVTRRAGFFWSYILKSKLSFMYRHRQLVHGNFNAPIEELLEQGIRVLDVGCGNGDWTLEMAADFPNSTFVGVDAASLFPSGSAANVPFNCSFVKANTLKGLPFKDGAFDFVFMRFMVFSFTPHDWAVTVQELTRLTRPGGWLELFEHSLQLERPPPNIDIWNAGRLSKVMQLMMLLPYLTSMIILFDIISH